ncbi:MAG: DUF262 domain-containing protein [Rickettsiales bacterium]|jgi:uncharacterized protein with ParB-like and HNH nuclease domain|nr:DUF262 domain-containing protein [Rickettsiales bacterium]
MAYIQISIKNAILGIRKNKYVLPAIQREMVWKPEQIEKLFDSVLSGYPFGSLLFWKYDRPADDTYKFYEFMKQYDEYDNTKNHNPEYPPAGETEIVGVLDGQQRLTAFYLGLCGYMNLHKRNYSWNVAESFCKNYLYLNLLYNKNDAEIDDIKDDYEFKFLTEEKVKTDNKNQPNKYLWFKVGDVLDFKEDLDYQNKIDGYSGFNEEKKKTIHRIMTRLFSAINEDRINAYEEQSNSLDKILNIFIRINSGGTKLGYTDFLMSLIVNQWGDGREKVNKAIDNINNECNFNIEKDIFLRGCLYLTGANLLFNADNFKKQTITHISNNFDKIIKYIKKSCEIFNQFGLNKDTMKSTLIVLPFAQFLMQNEQKKIEDADLLNVRRWIQLSVLSRAFSSGTTAYLTKLREIIRGKTDFPLDEIVKESNAMGHTMDILPEQLEKLVDESYYGSPDAWTLLTLLYPSYDYENIRYNEDHIYPKSKLTDEQLKNGGNFIANLQLLEHTENCEEKRAQSLEEWLADFCKRKNKNPDNYRKDNFMPSYSMTPDKFNDFIRDRRAGILKQLKTILGIK